MSKPVKNYRVKSETSWGQTTTTVYDLEGRYLGKTYRIETEPGNPWKWVCEIGSDFIDDCVTGLRTAYTVCTKAEAVANIAGAERKVNA